MYSSVFISAPAAAASQLQVPSRITSGVFIAASEPEAPSRMYSSVFTAAPAAAASQLQVPSSITSSDSEPEVPPRMYSSVYIGTNRLGIASAI